VPDDLSGWGSEEGLPTDRRLDRHEWRLDSLDRWRRDVDHRLSAAEDGIDAVTNEKKIAEAVAAKLRNERGGGEVATKLPWPAKVGAFVGAALVVADSIRGLLH